MELETPWGITYDKLSDNGIDVYPPATKQGECTAPYVVLKEGTTSKAFGLSTEYHLYDVMCYAPNYTSLEEIIGKAKSAMQTVFPMMMPTGNQTPPFYDDSYKAHMVSIEYRNNVRNKMI